MIAGSSRARTVRPKCAQTIRVAHANEQADDGRWRLDTCRSTSRPSDKGGTTWLKSEPRPIYRYSTSRTSAMLFGHDLEATLHELVDLSLIGKQLHWAVVGPLFRPLHLHLDELVDSWRELSDTVAERAVALGYVPDGQAQAVAAGSPLTPVAQGPVEDHAVIWGTGPADHQGQRACAGAHGQARRDRPRLPKMSSSTSCGRLKSSSGCFASSSPAGTQPDHALPLCQGPPGPTPRPQAARQRLARSLGLIR